MNIQQNINKVLTAIRRKGINIKIDRIESCSEKNEKYFYVYKVYIKRIVKNKYGEEMEKYVLDNDFTSKVKLLNYLVDKYKKIGSEADERRI